ncbi:MAG: ABC transporter permease [Chloroflexi bacterium]|nr:ABC transporter permease [Chloroflexota bacterium]
MQFVHEAPVSFRSSALRPGPLGLVAQAVREVWSRRRLIQYLVRADVKKKGSDTLLGNLWWVIDPLLQMVVYVVLFSIIFRRSQPDFPLFLFAAILPWKWFGSSIGDAVTSVVSQERLIKQIQFPKIVLPVASVAAGVVNFAFGQIVLLGLLLLMPGHLSIHVLWIPVIAAVQFLFTLALALLTSAVNVFYRDVGNLTRHVLLLWFYLSPALWSFERFADGQNNDVTRLGVAILRLNPFAILLDAYRTAIYGRVVTGADGSDTFTPGQVPDLLALGILALISLALVAGATLLFKRLEPAFAKVL